jgi:hypothetical protein
LGKTPGVSKWVIRTCFAARRRGIISRLYTNKGVGFARTFWRRDESSHQPFAVNLHNSRSLGGLSEDASMKKQTCSRLLSWEIPIDRRPDGEALSLSAIKSTNVWM